MTHPAIATSRTSTALESGRDSILAALRVARDARKRGTPRNAYAKSVADCSLSSEKLKPVDHILAMIDDFIAGEAPEAVMLGIPAAFAEYISARYRAKEADEAFPDVRIAEAKAEGIEDVAEAVFQANPSGPALLTLERSVTAHIIEEEREVRCARRAIA